VYRFENALRRKSKLAWDKETDEKESAGSGSTAHQEIFAEHKQWLQAKFKMAKPNSIVVAEKMQLFFSTCKDEIKLKKVVDIKEEWPFLF